MSSDQQKSRDLTLIKVMTGGDVVYQYRGSKGILSLWNSRAECWRHWGRCGICNEAYAVCGIQEEK